jgi:hypothetical protein
MSEQKAEYITKTSEGTRELLEAHERLESVKADPHADLSEPDMHFWMDRYQRARLAMEGISFAQYLQKPIVTEYTRAVLYKPANTDA